MNKTLSILIFALICPLALFAHTGVGDTHGCSHGFGHPLGGLDHLLAMWAVGLWAMQLGGTFVWRIPASFVGVMILGGMLGVMGIPLPAVELGIVTSVLVLGLLVAMAVRPPVAAAMALVGGFALFHGYAHGAEMPAGTGSLTYTLGFVLATCLLHACGLLAGLSLRTLASGRVVRLAGGAVALAGVWLAVA